MALSHRGGASRLDIRTLGSRDSGTLVGASPVWAPSFRSYRIRFSPDCNSRSQTGNAQSSLPVTISCFDEGVSIQRDLFRKRGRRQRLRTDVSCGTDPMVGPNSSFTKRLLGSQGEETSQGAT